MSVQRAIGSLAVVIVTVLSAIIISSCSGGDDGPKATPAPPTPTRAVVEPRAPTVATSTIPAATKVTADGLLAQLKAAGLPIGETVVYTAETDLNNLLGRPNGYEGKVNFHDNRLQSNPNFDTEGGGSLELFADADGAKARKSYIDNIGKSLPALVEYSFVNGRALLRLSKQLTPDQAKLYAGAFGALSVMAGPVPSTLPTSTATPAAAPIPSPLKPSALLAGNAAPAVPDGAPGKMVVAVVGGFAPGVVTQTSVPVIIRNNTSKPVSHVELSAGAKDPNGKIIASGKSQGFHPATLQPGEAALGYVYFGSSVVPQDATFDFSLQTSAPATSSFAIADLNVTQANPINAHIIGGATNATGKTIEGPFSVGAFCFDANGTLTRQASTFANGPDKLESGASVTFDLSLGSAPCPQFLVGVSGYYP
jgi:hypothetical protein